MVPQRSCQTTATPGDGYARRWLCRAGGVTLHCRDSSDVYSSLWDIRVSFVGVGIDFGNGINDGHTVRHLPKGGITVGLRRVVEVRVVDGVDEELVCRAVRFGCPCHRDRTTKVGKPRLCFIHDRSVCSLFVEFCVVTATLDHEVFDDAVKYQPIIKVAVDIREKVLDCDGGLIVCKLNSDGAVVHDLHRYTRMRLRGPCVIVCSVSTNTEVWSLAT
mmetsp:Transcript_59013/g.80590  ORF Transcript_59013/g.80590 Transcript_59013/m.80590 type:complete len:217 (-) Transcript_59013:46-696(-)